MGTSGTFSRAGCECRQIKKEIITQGRQIEANNCYLQAIGSAKSLTIPTDSFGYYQFNMGSLGSKLVRFGNFSNGSQLRLDFCETQGSSVTQAMSYTQTTSGSNISGTIVDQFLEEGASEQDKSKFTFSINNYSETGSSFDFSSASFQSQFNSRFGGGQATLVADNLSNLNQITGAFNNGVGDSNFTAHMACQFDDVLNNSTGAAKFSVSGTFPSFLGSTMGISDADLTTLGFTPTSALCPNTSFNETDAMGPANKPFSAASGGSCTFTATGTEPFQLSGSGNSESATVIASSATSHYGTINATTLASGSVTSPTISFNDTDSRAWDCTAPSGFTVVDASNVDVTACNAILTQLGGDSFESPCQQQENNAEIVQSQQASANLPPPKN